MLVTKCNQKGEKNLWDGFSYSSCSWNAGLVVTWMKNVFCRMFCQSNFTDLLSYKTHSFQLPFPKASYLPTLPLHFMIPSTYQSELREIIIFLYLWNHQNPFYSHVVTVIYLMSSLVNVAGYFYVERSAVITQYCILYIIDWSSLKGKIVCSRKTMWSVGTTWAVIYSRFVMKCNERWMYWQTYFSCHIYFVMYMHTCFFLQWCWSYSWHYGIDG